jgi:alpha-L-fucosidase
VPPGTDGEIQPADVQSLTGFGTAIRRTQAVNQIRLGEDIEHGQRIEGATVQAVEDGAWKTISTVSTVGYTRLVTLAAPVSTNHIRVLITQARAQPYLSTVALYRTVAPSGRE